MKQKCIYLSDRDIEKIKMIRQEKGLSSDSQVISFLLHQSEEECRIIAKAVREELEENYLPKEKIRWGVRTAEQNSMILLDTMNTLLWMLDAKECIFTETVMHPVISQSRDALKKKIAYFKQKSDERKSKLGMNEIGGHK